MTKKDIREATDEEIKDFFKKNNIASYRMSQIKEWLWKKGVSSFDEMTSISKENRALLKDFFEIKSMKINHKLVSKDGSIKYLFKLHDNQLIESVLIPSKQRITACISSQVGCSLDCKFCATGSIKLSRNLYCYEMFDQIFYLIKESKKEFGRSITNIVFMGMGEPLLNYKNLMRSIKIITEKNGLNISPKRITVSTSGIVKMIKKLADDNVKFNLAISLHSTKDRARSELMPINKSNDLNKLKNSIKYFYEKTSIRVTYEYILFNNLNDDLESAKSLAKFCKITPCKINLIEYNPIEDFDFKKSSKESTIKFIDFLEEKNIIVTLRRSKGSDINAACGQLANKLI